MSASGGKSGRMAIVTLIAAGRLDDRLVERALGLLREHDPNADFDHWVDEGDAAILATVADVQTARWALQGMPDVDVVVQPDGARLKRLLVADMDSTIIGQECIDELADYAGFKPQVAAITERAMRGELDFVAALKERVALLEGLDEQVIAQCLAERIGLNPGAATLVRTMRSNGSETILVSGGFTSFVEPIARKVGFDRFEANVLGVSGGKLTGATEGRVVDAKAKRTVMVEARERLGLGLLDTMAIGDGANDRLRVDEAGLGVAYRAKPALAEIADAILDHNDLSALLWVQGIPKAQWIAD